MPRGCVILIILGSLAILVSSLVLRIFFMPAYQSKGTSRIIYVIELAIAEYGKDYGTNPAGRNQEIARILLGKNSRNKAYLASDSIVIREGQLVDLWKRPLRFAVKGEELNVSSAGENGEFDDSDDIASESAE